MLRRLVLFLAFGALLLGGALALAAAPLATARPLGGADSATVIVGSVKSVDGRALVSASVYIENTTLGTLSGEDGRYRIEVPAGRIRATRIGLIARLIGYRPATDTITLRPGENRHDFKLVAAPVQLSEVVVTGTGTTTSRAQLGSAVSAAYPATVDESQSGGLGALGWPTSNAPPNGVSAGDLATADEIVVVEKRATLTYSAPAAAREIRIRGSRKAEPGGRVDANVRDAAKDPAAAVRRALLAAPPTQGVLRARDAEGDLVGEFPLRHTDVQAEISGFLARAVVEQRYSNPFERTIEAVYVFPLPSLAAVNDFVMEVGGRRIVGVVRPRAEAERIYREARARGQTASLLTQERPNIFTQSVANIEPGGEVKIRITYFERLAYEHGEYAWVFPMVVGPRYIPGNPTGGALLASNDSSVVPPADGGGWAPNTDVVPDASRITPPVLKPGRRSGHDIGLTVTLDAGLPISRIHSVAHQVEIERPSASRYLVHLSKGDSIPNRDFVLRWSVAGAETQFGVLTHRDRTGGYLTLAMQPTLAPADEQVMPREITFIMDVSGSMMGTPIGMSKDLVERTLDRLRPSDRFNIVYFASGNAQLWESARPRTEENVRAAKQFLENLSAGGGTEMLAGVERALHARHDREHLQMFVFLTDGYVGDEERILSTIKGERGEARFFGFGIGSSVNRYLIDGIGQEGGGESFAVIPRDSTYAERAVGQLFDAIDSPVLVDVGIDWNGLPVTDQYPAKLRDLFAGQTINVLARYTAPARGTAYVTGRIGDRRVRIPVSVVLPDTEPRHAALAPMWARYRIADLSSDMLGADSTRRTAIEQEITDVAVTFRLVSQYTAFVAVDESRIVGDGHPVRILQPVELPEGVSYEGIFGEQPVGLPVRIPAWGVNVQQTESGAVRVGAVDAGSAAANVGIARGATLRAVDGAPITDVAQLERVLMQTGAKGVKVETGKGKEVVLPTP